MSNAIDALKTIITFGISNDFEDSETLDDLSQAFHEFVTSEDSEVQVLLPKIIKKISEVVQDFEKNGSSDNGGNNSKSPNESFNMSEYCIQLANRYVID